MMIWPRTHTAERLRTSVTLLARLVLGAVFALSSFTKVTSSASFRDSVAEYHLLPTPLITPFATALPWIEALIALYLLIGLFLRFTAVVTAILLLLFTAALAVSLANGNTAHGCGCLPQTGPLGSLPIVGWLAGGATITLFDVVRDLVFIALAAVIYWGDRYTLSVEGLLNRTVVSLDSDNEDEQNNLEQ